jgi:thiol-disulfide isomerase/thioredoxin
MYVESEFCTSTGGFGKGWNPSWGDSFRYYVSTDGVDATQACCGCGGGLAVSPKPKASARVVPNSFSNGQKRNVDSVIDREVTELSDDSFQQYLDRVPTAFVMFYAPWCGACKGFKPTFEATAKEGVLPGVAFARVDATQNNQLARRFKISSYPTLHIFTNGNAHTPAVSKVSTRSPNEIKKLLIAVHTGAELPQQAVAQKAQRKPKTDPKTKSKIYRDLEPASSVVKSFDSAQDFRDAVKSNPDQIFVVKMYAEWCSYCKKVQMQYSYASTLLQQRGVSKATLAKINIYAKSGKNDMIPNYYGIKTTPAFVMFKQGDPDTMYNLDLAGDQREAEPIANLVEELVTGRRDFPEPQQRYCVEDDVCFFEMPCTKQNWGQLTQFFDDKGWTHDAINVKGLANLDTLLQSKPLSWVLFTDMTKCASPVAQRVALEMASNRPESVDALDEETRKLWNIIVVDVNDPENAETLEKYLPRTERRVEGQSIRVFVRDQKTVNIESDMHTRMVNMDRLLYPLLPSLPDYSHDLYVIGIGMIKTIWSVRLNSNFFEQWALTPDGRGEGIDTALDTVMEELWDTFFADGKREFIQEDFEDFKSMYREFSPKN